MRRMSVLLVVVSAAFFLTVTAGPSPLGAQPQEPPRFEPQRQAPSKQEEAQAQQQKPAQQQPQPSQPSAAQVAPKQQPQQPVRPRAIPAAAVGGLVNGSTRAGGMATTAGTNRYAVDMTFVAASGLTLGNRVAHVFAGRSDDLAVQDRQRTVTATTTVRPGRKAGCVRIDVVVRDRTIDASGHFNKTVWESGSEPCGGDTITLGPKNEVNVRVAIRPEK